MIPIIFIRPPTLKCPRCETVLKRGKPRFGPAEIKCSNCALVLETKLTPWADFSPIKKVFVAIGEVIAPSRWGPFLFVLLLNIALGLIFVCGLVVFLETISQMSEGVPAILGWSIAGLVILAIVSIPIFRLIRLIKESNEYSLTGVPPTWKAGIF